MEDRAHPGSLKRKELEAAGSKHAISAADDGAAEIALGVEEDPAAARVAWRAGQDRRRIVSYFCKD
jgi:hypothetical protein